MDILGIDCSSKAVNCVLIDKSKAWKYSFCLKSDARDMDLRLIELFGDFNKLIMNLSDIKFAVIENAIYLQNVKATIGIAQVISAVKVALSTKGIKFIGVDNKSWKKAVLGDGNASKDKIMDFALALWGKENITSQDVADASCIALWGVMRLEDG